jgi:hypothetical protein
VALLLFNGALTIQMSGNVAGLTSSQLTAAIPGGILLGIGLAWFIGARNDLTLRGLSALKCAASLLPSTAKRLGNRPVITALLSAGRVW